MNASPADGPLFRNETYRRCWAVGLLTALVRWLEMLALGLYALDETGSPALVALLVILRFLPMALFGPWLGGLSDRAPAARLLRLGLVLVAATSAAMLALFALDLATYPLVAAAAFLSGVFWASDLPIRRRIVGDAVAPRRLAAAMAIDGATSNAMRCVGPLLGGLLYGQLGAAGIFALSTAAFLAAFAVARGISGGVARASAPRASGAGARAALAHAWANPDARNILLVTVVFNLWGFPYLAMVPVIGRESLGLSSAEVGAVTAIEGLFALLGALIVARTVRHGAGRRVYFWSTVLTLLVILGIGLAPSTATLALGLAAGGMFASAFAAMQSTLIYEAAPPEMRGRYLGLMTLAIGFGALGFLNVGLTAELLGPERALVFLGLEGLPALALIAWDWRELRESGADPKRRP